MRVIYLFCLLALYQTFAIEIYQISKNTRFIFQKRDEISIPVNNVRIELNLVLDTIYSEVDHLRLQVKNASSLCDKTPTDTYCTSTLSQINGEMKDTIRIRDELRAFTRVTKRNKRFLEECLFVMAYMMVTRNQTDSVQEMIKVQQQYINDTTKALNERIETLEGYVIKTNNINYLQSLLLSVMRYNSLVSNLLDLVIQKDGTKLFYAADYLNFSRIIDDVNGSLEKNTSLYSTSKLEIFKSSLIQACPQKNGLNMTLIVPIRGNDSDHFLYTVHEVPFLDTRGKFRIIRQHNEYLAYNPKTNNTVTFRESEMKRCKELGSTKICPMNKEVREQNCEIEAFFNNTQCGEGTPYTGKSFILFLKPNSLYLFTEEETITLKCFENYTFTVNYSIHIKIPYNCSIIIGKDIFRHSEIQLNSTIITPSMNLTQLKLENLKDAFDRDSLFKIAARAITSLDQLTKDNIFEIRGLNEPTGFWNWISNNQWFFTVLVIALLLLVRMSISILILLKDPSPYGV